MANSPLLGTLEQIDYVVKQIIKEILYLHPSTTDGIMYTNKSLGVQRVANIVKLKMIKNGLQMTKSDDKAV